MFSLSDGSLDRARNAENYTAAERGDTQKVLNLFRAKKGARFNEGTLQTHPSQPGTVIRMQDGERVLEQMTWGFPLAQKSKKTGKPLKPKPVNNARFDKLHTYFWKWAASKPEHRCLIPTARYCEACGEPGCMTESWLSVKDQPIFAWAGLWANSDVWGAVYTGVMTDNAPDLIDIHDRSPVIIDPADWEFWLSAPLEDLYRCDRPYPADRMNVEHTEAPWFRKKGELPAGPALL